LVVGHIHFVCRVRKKHWFHNQTQHSTTPNLLLLKRNRHYPWLKDNHVNWILMELTTNHVLFVEANQMHHSFSPLHIQFFTVYYYYYYRTFLFCYFTSFSHNNNITTCLSRKSMPHYLKCNSMFLFFSSYFGILMLHVSVSFYQCILLCFFFVFLTHNALWHNRQHTFFYYVVYWLEISLIR
jgi:hypothetical protein